MVTDFELHDLCDSCDSCDTPSGLNGAPQVMTKIGAICLITIGVWVVIEMGVQFGAYKHVCYAGAGKSDLI